MEEYNTEHNAARNAVHNAVHNKELNKDPARQARTAVLRNVGLFNSTVLNRSSRSKGLGAFDPFSQFDVDSTGRARQSRKASAKIQKHNIRLNSDGARQREKAKLLKLNQKPSHQRRAWAHRKQEQRRWGGYQPELNAVAEDLARKPSSVDSLKQEISTWGAKGAAALDVHRRALIEPVRLFLRALDSGEVNKFRLGHKSVFYGKQRVPFRGSPAAPITFLGFLKEFAFEGSTRGQQLLEARNRNLVEGEAEEQKKKVENEVFRARCRAYSVYFPPRPFSFDSDKDEMVAAGKWLEAEEEREFMPGATL